LALEQTHCKILQDDIVLLVVDHAGHEHTLPALDGWRVTEVIRDWGVPLKATCGGACACASCHVYVDEPWVERLVPPSAEEEDRLDDALAVEPSSRLACQILTSAGISGLKVRLAPGSEMAGSEKE
jgi:ferredoxin, 2Fe-2S